VFVVVKHAEAPFHEIVSEVERANPAPDNDTPVPTGPDDFDSEKEGVTVKFEVADAPCASAPLKACAPAGVGRIVTEHANAPVALVVAEQTTPPFHVTLTTVVGS